ncbi:recombinase family protein [Streptomyces hydrogenans]|uniref:Serine recombinase n=1 Tax=Streptomyces hydrogenans TaxID=1873719 RepID=A0ABQ3PP22_9ACTN|nr:recombinase family protein [Streptomyces hydrogenans]GHG04581.1 serine recombinase [Streptomyces hydrogenans]GHI26769.1 serine recombinase [Streptomyces hydrogenans]
MTGFQRGAIYTRISRDDELTGDGVTRQDEDAGALALARSIPVQGRYTDNDISATTGKRLRPDYERLLTAVRADQVDVVIVAALSRLWRNRRERAEGMELFRKHGVSILAVKGPELDLTTASGRLLAGLLGEVDSFEVEQMSEREKREMRQRVERGLPATGPRAFGYSADGWTTIPEEMSEIVKAYETFVVTRSVSGITRDLRERGILNKDGEPWTNNGVRHVLKNPRYAALREYEGKLYEGKWPAGIPEDLWRAAQHIFETEDRATSPGPARRHLLSGIALCGICADGTTVTSGSRGVKKNRTEGDEERPEDETELLVEDDEATSQPTYRCRVSKHLTRNMEPVNDCVEEYVIARLSRPDAADLFHDEAAPGAEDLRAQAVALRARLKALAAAFADDDEADVMEFRDATRRLRERLADVESRMAHPQRARILSGLVDADDVRTAWKGLSLDRRRAVVNLLAEVTVDRAGGGGRRPFNPGTVRIVPRV